MSAEGFALCGGCYEDTGHIYIYIIYPARFGYCLSSDCCGDTQECLPAQVYLYIERVLLVVACLLCSLLLETAETEQLNCPSHVQVIAGGDWFCRPAVETVVETGGVELLPFYRTAKKYTTPIPSNLPPPKKWADF